MNGQHLRALPSEELVKIIGERWKTAGILLESEGMFVKVYICLLTFWNQNLTNEF